MYTKTTVVYPLYRLIVISYSRCVCACVSFIYNRIAVSFCKTRIVRIQRVITSNGFAWFVQCNCVIDHLFFFNVISNRWLFDADMLVENETCCRNLLGTCRHLLLKVFSHVISINILIVLFFEYFIFSFLLVNKYVC